MFAPPLLGRKRVHIGSEIASGSADAIQTLALSIWDYFGANPRWLSLINNENLHEGKFLERSPKLTETISPVIDLLRATLARGVLQGATQQFSTYGLSGARVDAIATAADTNERMIYYYFQSKEGLYVAVLGCSPARSRLTS
jgi:hypothetical protein